MKEVLEKLISEKNTIKQMALKLNKSKTSIRYWLVKFNLKTVRSKGVEKNLKEGKFCKRCETKKNSEEFYKRRNGLDLSSYCKVCTGEQTLERQRSFKKQCVDYKGGECACCGYKKYIGALDFHHLDPNEKDFSISSVKLTTFSENIKLELDKCLLVCSNCHREIHGGERKF